MKVNGESIHGTTASLFPKVSWNGRSTTKRLENGGTRVYLHLFSRPQGGKLVVSNLVNRPDEASILGQSGKLAVSGEKGAWTIQLPDGPLDPIATVIALTFPGEPTIETPAAAPSPAK